MLNEDIRSEKITELMTGCHAEAHDNTVTIYCEGNKAQMDISYAYELSHIAHHILKAVTIYQYISFGIVWTDNLDVKINHRFVDTYKDNDSDFRSPDFDPIELNFFLNKNVEIEQKLKTFLDFVVIFSPEILLKSLEKIADHADPDRVEEIKGILSHIIKD